MGSYTVAMRVELYVYFPFREELESSPLALELPEGADVSAALAALVKRYPQLRDRLLDDKGRPHRYVSALVNGVSVQFIRGFATALSPGDEVTLLPPVGGG